MGPRVSVERDLYRVVDYIMNHATPRQLEVIRAALQRRDRDTRQMASGANIRNMATDLSLSVGAEFDTMGRVKDMTLGFIREMVRRLIPDIPEEHLQLLLEEWVPDRAEGPKEDNLPADVVESMLVQFLDYSLGRMKDEDKEDLQQDRGWARRYWSIFSESTHGLIRTFLLGSIEEEEFWRRFRDA